MGLGRPAGRRFTPDESSQIGGVISYMSAWTRKTSNVIKKIWCGRPVPVAVIRSSASAPSSFSSSSELLFLLFTCLLHLREAELSVIVVAPGHPERTSGWAGEVEEEGSPTRNKSGARAGLDCKRWRLMFHCRALVAGLKHPSLPPLMLLGGEGVGFRTPLRNI